MKQAMYRKSQSIFLLMTGLIFFATNYIEYVQGLHPCPLCLMQRLCVLISCVLFLLGVLLPQRRCIKILTITQIALAMTGLYFASRQMWLQSLPVGDGAVCLPGLQALMHYLSWYDVLQAFIWGTGDCGEVTWQWLGLSMPAWSALYFVIMIIFNGAFLYRGRFLKS